MRRYIILAFISFVAFFVIYTSNTYYIPPTFEISNYYISNAFNDYQSSNVVTSIYLVYRYYDTIFEALMLMFSLVGVIYMSINEGDHENDKR